jgi:hypothetical protein
MGFGWRLVLAAAALQGCGGTQLGSGAVDAASEAAGDSTVPVDTLDADGFQLGSSDASVFAPEASAEPCGDAGPFFFEITGDGPDKTWNAECGYSRWNFPVAFREFGGEGDGVGHETAAACASFDAGASVIAVSAYQRSAGTSDTGLIGYSDPMGRKWSGQGAVTFNEWGPVGTVVEGTYNVPVILVAHPDAGPTLSLSGSFRVCHAYDGEQAP